jgi:DNA-binding MarR family transcriptional regulator
MHDVNRRVDRSKTQQKAERRDPFYVEREVMEKQLYRDTKLSRSGLRVGISLAHLFNRTEHRNSGRLMAWPSERWLAKDTCMSISSVKRAVQDLEDCGHFRVIRGTGRTENRYVAALTVNPGRPKLRVIDGSKPDTPGVSSGEL